MTGRWLCMWLLAACAPEAVYEPPPEIPAPPAGDTLARINLEKLCHAEREADAVAVPIADRMATIERFLVRQLSHDGVRALCDRALAAASPGDVLRRGARDLGMPHCPLADLLDWIAQPDAEACAAACIRRLDAGDDIALSADCRLGCRDVVP